MSVALGNEAPDLDGVLADIAATAGQRDDDATPVFPESAISALEHTGVLAFNARAGEHRPPAWAELDLVRRVARADASVGRIVDGHLNAVERLAV